VRAKFEAFVSLHPAAAPLRSLVAAIRRVQGGHSGAGSESRPDEQQATTFVSRVASRPMIMPLTARLICARLVRESGAFFARGLTHPPGVSAYHLRESGLLVGVRHTTQDGATLAEVFHRRDYEPGEELGRVIGEPERILDLGANIGLFGAFAAVRWPSSTIVGYEPDPANASLHEQAIRVNGLARRWSLVCAAAGAHTGEVELAAGRAMESFVVAPDGNPGLPTIKVPMVDVMDQVGAADLVKIDIEGGEWEILADPRFAERPPRAIVLEYHPHLCPAPDPRAEAERLLGQAQMTVKDLWHRDDGYGMLWAWRA
jgi:FkbM family methyltransferase